MNSQPIQRIYLTAAQAAEIVQLSAGTLENWRYARKGPPWVKVGGSVRYEESALYAWLDAQTVSEIPLNPS
jgi:predicted DNA-binding transcriptional regulator AlpA